MGPLLFLVYINYLPEGLTTNAKIFADGESISVIANFVVFVSLDNTHYTDQVIMKLISQLIKGIWRVLQKLLKFFNDTIISIFFVPPSSALLGFLLNLNEALLLAAWNLSSVKA